MRRSVVVVLALSGTAACSYLFELPATSISPTETDASDDAIADGAAPPIDARIDVAPPPRFCATQTAPFLYCNDLDDDPAPDLASIGTVQVTGGQLVLSNAVALSPPRSMLASIRGTNASAAVTRTLGTSPDGITLSFHLLVSAWETTEGPLSRIELVDGPAQCLVRLDGKATTWSVTQVCSTNGTEASNITADSTSPIVRGRWQRFALKVTFAPTKTVTLDIDEARVIEVVGVAELQRAPASITLGPELVPSGSVTLFQDNVLVTSP